MSTMELVDEPIEVAATIDGQGRLRPQKLIWRDRKYTLTGVGRQWEEEEGRFVLTEAANGTRFELQLRRRDLIWRLRRVWWGQSVA